MVEKTVDLSDLKKLLPINNKQDEESIEKNSVGEKNSVVLFFSFDIVNSTAYKAINYYGWSIVIDNIICEIRKRVKEKISQSEVWRVLGDEVIFIVKICDVALIGEYISHIYKILVTFSDEIENGIFFAQIKELSETTINLMKIENVITLQACAWIALVTDKRELNEGVDPGYVENVFEVIEESNNNKFYEFIGADIDAGFRLSKQTREKRLVLSFELSYLLSKHESTLSNIYIVAYRSLKGIWNGAPYPIIWYYDSIFHEGKSFRDSFPYDAIEKDDIGKEYLVKNAKKLKMAMYTRVKYALDKIAEDRRLLEKIERIENAIIVQKSRVKSFIVNPKLELHCVAVCFDAEDKVMIVKRKGREILDAKWEFGCAKANSKESLIDIIVADYAKDFGIDIKMLVDRQRKDCQPIPLAVYTIPKKEETHIGIIFLAKIVSGEPTYNSNKHEDIRMLGEKEIDELDANQCVPDMIETIKKAFVMKKELEEFDCE